MEKAMTRWLAREQAWAAERDKRKKKELILWAVAVPVAAIVIVFVLALTSGGGLADAMHRIKFALLWACIIDLLLIVGMVPQMPGRQYMKYLKIYLDRTFASNSEREELAAQMMGDRGPDTVVCIPWKESGIGEQRVWVTKDYLLSTRGNGRLDLVCLNQVKEMEVDRKDFHYRAGNSDVKVHVHDELFTITFIYGETGHLDEKIREFRGDKVNLNYPSRELRDKVVAAVQRLRPEKAEG